MKQADNTARLRRMLRMGNLYSYKGKIRSSVGMTLEATGIVSNVGDICEIRMSSGETVLAEVTGIRDETTVLMPYQDIDGIGAGSVVTNTGQKLTISMSDALIGRTIDALGNPIDGGPELPQGVRYSINGNHANPMNRPPISQVIEMGVRVIDSMLTIGKGQRMGIFAGTGVGRAVCIHSLRETTTDRPLWSIAFLNSSTISSWFLGNEFMVCRCSGFTPSPIQISSIFPVPWESCPPVIPVVRLSEMITSMSLSSFTASRRPERPEWVNVESPIT